MQICFQNRHEQPAPLLGRGLRQSFSFTSWSHFKEVALFALLMLGNILVLMLNKSLFRGTQSRDYDKV